MNCEFRGSGIKEGSKAQRYKNVGFLGVKNEYKNVNINIHKFICMF